jgi:exodeoxyribonuclease VII small subunit
MDSLTFELEASVAALQDGRMPLDQALQYYQDGVKLAQYCNGLLQKAELTVQQLSADSMGTLSVEPLDL